MKKATTTLNSIVNLFPGAIVTNIGCGPYWKKAKLELESGESISVNDPQDITEDILAKEVKAIIFIGEVND